MIARYDGNADWYDDFNAPYAAASQDDIAALLGPGEGLCPAPGRRARSGPAAAG
ncbi:MAG: hypothetical protein HOY71_51920 [Nonomuraea sp.]|nr:hypothetical protein [Nonomuraea sp.]